MFWLIRNAFQSPQSACNLHVVQQQVDGSQVALGVGGVGAVPPTSGHDRVVCDHFDFGRVGFGFWSLCRHHVELAADGAAQHCALYRHVRHWRRRCVSDFLLHNRRAGRRRRRIPLYDQVVSPHSRAMCPNTQRNATRAHVLQMSTHRRWKIWMHQGSSLKFINIPSTFFISSMRENGSDRNQL